MPDVATRSPPTLFRARPEPGRPPATLEDSFADLFRVWGEEREAPLGKMLVSKFARLSEIIAEMRSLGLFEECNVAPNVLHHRDLELRNMVGGVNDQYKVTGLLD